MHLILAGGGRGEGGGGGETPSHLPCGRMASSDVINVTPHCCPPPPGLRRTSPAPSLHIWAVSSHLQNDLAILVQRVTSTACAAPQHFTASSQTLLILQYTHTMDTFVLITDIREKCRRCTKKKREQQSRRF